MTTSPLIEEARRLLALGRPYEEPSRCREMARRLRMEGENDLANELERAARKPHPFGTSTCG